MLQAYRFEHPSKEEQFAVVGGWSYLWAGLFGAFYVAAMGFRRHFIRALLINLAYGLLALAIFGASSVLVAPFIQSLTLVVAAPLLVLLQGRSMIRIVRDGYRRRGWWTTRL